MTFLPGTLFLIDTSAAARIAHNPVVRSTIENLIDEGMAATCVLTDMEAIFSGRDPKTIAKIVAERREYFINLAVTEEIAERAKEVQILLASRGLHRVAGPTDVLIAAIAENYRATLLHYDADFEHIASVTGQQQQWIVPRGSID